MTDSEYTIHHGLGIPDFGLTTAYRLLTQNPRFFLFQ